MTQKGPHTWDLILHYHGCPHCKRIIESREDYHYQLGKYIKEVTCPYCKHEFTVLKATRPSFAPLFGEGDHAEMDWS